LTRENDSLLKSIPLIDDSLQQGREALATMIRQRDHLKGFRRKALDIGNSMGLSSSLLRLIERTDAFNTIIIVCGCLLTLLIMAVVYYLLHY